jgi:hypothetical protein
MGAVADERSGRTCHKGKYLTDGVDVSPSFGWHSSVLPGEFSW